MLGSFKFLMLSVILTLSSLNKSSLLNIPPISYFVISVEVRILLDIVMFVDVIDVIVDVKSKSGKYIVSSTDISKSVKSTL